MKKKELTETATLAPKKQTATNGKFILTEGEATDGIAPNQSRTAQAALVAFSMTYKRLHPRKVKRA